MVGAGAALGRELRAASAGRAGQRQPALPCALRLHLHRVRQRQEHGRDAGVARRAAEERSRNRVARGRRRAAEDHAAAPGENAGTMSAITTHVLDTSTGRPAAGVPVTLEKQAGGGWQSAGQGITNQDGRITDLLGGAKLAAGTYRLTFDTATYFRANQQSS